MRDDLHLLTAPHEPRVDRLPGRRSAVASCVFNIGERFGEAVLDTPSSPAPV
jgi:hypothetical protein